MQKFVGSLVKPETQLDTGCRVPPPIESRFPIQEQQRVALGLGNAKFECQFAAAGADAAVCRQCYD